MKEKEKCIGDVYIWLYQKLVIKKSPGNLDYFRNTSKNQKSMRCLREHVMITNETTDSPYLIENRD